MYRETDNQVLLADNVLRYVKQIQRAVRAKNTLVKVEINLPAGLYPDENRKEVEIAQGSLHRSLLVFLIHDRQFDHALKVASEHILKDLSDACLEFQS